MLGRTPAPTRSAAKKGTPFEAGWRVPGLMWWPNHIPAGALYGEMMSHIDCRSTLAAMAGITPPPHGDGSITAVSRFTSIVSTTALTFLARQITRRARRGFTSTVRNFGGVRADIGDDPSNPDVNIAWKYLFTSKDTWLGPTLNSGGIGALYDLTMDPYEKYDMFFNGAVATRSTTTSPGRYAGMDNGWSFSLMEPVIMDFNKSIVDFPSVKRFPGEPPTMRFRISGTRESRSAFGYEEADDAAHGGHG